MADKPGTGTAWADQCFDNDGNLILAGTANVYTAKTARRIFGYYAGLRFCGRIPATSTGASTIAVDEAPAIAIRKSGNTAIASGDLVSGVYYDFLYDETNSVMQVMDVTPASTTLTAGDGIIITSGAIMTTIKRRNVADITAGDTMIATDRAKTVNIASGTGTMAFTAAATLGDGWWAIIKNSGTGDVTLNPGGAELIDGLATWALYPGGSILVTCDGSAFNSVLLSPMEKTFNASGTLTKPGAGTWCEGHIWGGGASGARGIANVAGGGGGGGGCTPFKFLLSQLAATETITIGAGGASQTVAATGGNTGGNSTLGTLLTGYGGGGGSAGAGAAGGGGGGTLGAGSPTNGGSPPGDDIGFNSGFGGAASVSGGSGAAGRPGAYGGASGGGGDAATGGAGGASLWGGAGGGGGGDTTAGGAGGTSVFGGAGGAGNTANTVGTAGSQPGGGGGGTETANSGAGGAGRLTIRIY